MCKVIQTVFRIFYTFNNKEAGIQPGIWKYMAARKTLTANMTILFVLSWLAGATLVANFYTI